MPQLKPSEQIRALMPIVARQRFAKARAQQRITGPPVILSNMEEQQMLSAIGQDPLTWVMAIMAYLDQADLTNVVGAIHDQLLTLERKSQP